ncbi:hypothetical protein M427DRAFT_252350 [Gonapodya prolifera JEL478]|uniref:F-box domain-containing protein n=1 Tax=Gonapodya prolifera (strain JEL478) TaxID=1344416 RepID=A0A139AL20_GONPJ|nr:hypothetical protein M427DRAFT_252350 [Gonapodya prolifera JEL478]|eukprot:KXS17489.1 hypothetical protein M427DRAFT_252350 [Gonapodya prolifera JEL478]
MTLLLSLPDETILKILSLLDAKDVLAFGIVNRRCHKVSNESLLWYSLCHHQSMAEPTFRKEMEMPVPVASHCPDSPTFDWKSEWRWRFGKLRAFDTSHGIANHSGIVWNIVHSEDSEYAFSSGSDGAIKYWKLMPAPDGGKDFGCVRTIFAAEGIGKVDPNVVGESTTIQKWGERALVCSWRGYIRILVSSVHITSSSWQPVTLNWEEYRTSSMVVSWPPFQRHRHQYLPFCLSTFPNLNFVRPATPLAVCDCGISGCLQLDIHTPRLPGIQREPYCLLLRPTNCL